jgi:hypothetical protein
MISTRQRGIYSIAHKKRAIVTNTIEKMMAKIASPKMVRLIATPSRSGSPEAAVPSNLAARRCAALALRISRDLARKRRHLGFSLARHLDQGLVPAGIVEGTTLRFSGAFFFARID